MARTDRNKWSLHSKGKVKARAIRVHRLFAKWILAGRADAEVEKKKTMIITRETQEMLIVRRPRVSQAPPVRGWCEVCAEELDMLTPEEAAAVANVNTRKIYAWVEAGRIHHTETEQGEVLVCPKQLLR